MKQVLLDQDEVDALKSRTDELCEQTLKLYEGGWHTDEEIQRQEQRAGCLPALLPCVAALLVGGYGIWALVRWLLQNGAT